MPQRCRELGLPPPERGEVGAQAPGGGRLRRTQVSNLSGDRFENTGQVSSSVRIPEAHHGGTVIGQPLIAFAIGVFVAGLCVLAPVKFNRET